MAKVTKVDLHKSSSGVVEQESTSSRSGCSIRTGETGTHHHRGEFDQMIRKREDHIRNTIVGQLGLS